MRSSHVGPVRCLLRTYGPTKGYVFGNFGESSDNVLSLLKTTTGIVARDNWMGWARGASLRRKPLIPLASTGSGGLATHAAALTRFSRSSTTPLGTAPSAEARHLRRSLPTPPASSPKRPRMSQNPRATPSTSNVDASTKC
jgi:hypothetical protein